MLDFLGRLLRAILLSLKALALIPFRLLLAISHYLICGIEQPSWAIEGGNIEED
jgi:hypothetical protein